MAKILVVEDEASYRDTLAILLPKEGHEVVVAADGHEALARFADSNPDLILLDLMLPGISGNEVCRTIRQTSNVPIIMLTAKDSETDEVVGLEIGADDYITKLASSSKIIARINKVLSRRIDPMFEDDDVLSAGPVTLDIERHIVTVHGVKVAFPLKEFELLELLMRNVNRVLPRHLIIERVWGSNYYGDTKTLDVHVKRLRTKIEPDSERPQYLVTVRGLGYKFEA
ncbi:MAG: response regulator transcription factor [Rhodoluna sp.]|nr:response regulator transcription factor [Rhodoluna sp.]